MRNQIFRQGFTTKKEEGHGLGLSIVSNLIHEAGGELSMETGEKETSFQFTIPIKQAGRIKPFRKDGRRSLEKSWNGCQFNGKKRQDNRESV